MNVFFCFLSVGLQRPLRYTRTFLKQHSKQISEMAVLYIHSTRLCSTSHQAVHVMCIFSINRNRIIFKRIKSQRHLSVCVSLSQSKLRLYDQVTGGERRDLKELNCELLQLKPLNTLGNVTGTVCYAQRFKVVHLKPLKFQ